MAHIRKERAFCPIGFLRNLKSLFRRLFRLRQHSVSFFKPGVHLLLPVQRCLFLPDQARTVLLTQNRNYHQYHHDKQNHRQNQQQADNRLNHFHGSLRDILRRNQKKQQCIILRQRSQTVVILHTVIFEVSADSALFRQGLPDIGKHLIFHFLQYLQHIVSLNRIPAGKIVMHSGAVTL